MHWGIGALISFLVPAILYALTAPQGLPFGDSGELITAACTLGIPHPPGFPVYCLLGKLFCTLPLESPAYRLNLLSGLLGAVTCLLVYATLKELKLHTLVAIGAALSLATSRLFWSAATEAEVYTLHTCFLALLVWLAVRYRNRHNTWERHALFLVFGLSLANHWPLTLVAVPPIALLVAQPIWQAGWRVVLGGLMLLLIGLLPYAYLPWRSMALPAIDWNHPRTVSNFLAHVLRLTTSEREPGWDVSASLKLLGHFGVHGIGRDFSWIGFPLAVWGLQVFWQRARRLVTALLFGWVCTVVPILLWVRVPWSGPAVDAIMQTLMPASLFVALGVGLGLQALRDHLCKTSA